MSERWRGSALGAGGSSSPPLETPGSLSFMYLVYLRFIVQCLLSLSLSDLLDSAMLDITRPVIAISLSGSRHDCQHPLSQRRVIQRPPDLTWTLTPSQVMKQYLRSENLCTVAI